MSCSSILLLVNMRRSRPGAPHHGRRPYQCRGPWLDGDKYYVAGSVRDDEERTASCAFLIVRVGSATTRRWKKEGHGASWEITSTTPKIWEGERSVYWVEGIGSSEPVFHSKDDADLWSRRFV